MFNSKNADLGLEPRYIGYEPIVEPLQRNLLYSFHLMYILYQKFFYLSIKIFLMSYVGTAPTFK